ncbi:MAG: hypothetical protein ACLQLC_00635 [Candidatus Sulfotelmatobacter sp.]
MLSFAPSRVFRFTLLVLTVATAPLLSWGAAPAQSETPTPSNIVIGFVGGFVRHDNQNHGPVQLAQRIRRTVPKDTYVQVFENRRRKQAYETVVHLLDTDHDGVLSAREKAGAHIILFGHSWGASAAVLLARDLRRKGVPVALTVQVDSIAKVWQNDQVIPDNVAAAVNFYQPHGIVHGRKQIIADNPQKTKILGNYLEDYKKNPVACSGYTWADHFFTRGHMQSECDPRLWSQVEQIVRQRLSPETSSVTSAATAHSRP